MVLKGERGPGGIYEITSDSHEGVFKFPSVTTILSKLKDPGVSELLEKIGQEKFDIISMNAANRGTVMHGYCENYTKALMQTKDKDRSLLYTQTKTPKDFTNFPPSVFEKGRNLFYNIYHSEFIDEMKAPLLIEGLMVSFEYKYAGRTDIIYVNQENEIILGDYKSCSAPLLPHSNKVVKYKMQLAAYINAFEEVYKKTIKEGVIWASNPNGVQKFVLTKFEYPIYLAYFKSLLAA